MSSPTSALADGVLHFLSSLGKRSEAELYLRVFRELPTGQFALLAATSGVLKDHTATVAEQLGFLRHLGLFPSLLLGALDSVSDEQVTELQRALSEVGLASRIANTKQTPAQRSEGEILIYRMTQPSEEELCRIVGEVGPRKLLFLRRAGGIGPHREQRFELSRGHFLPVGPSGIGVINLTSDGADLRQSPLLGDEDRLWLERSERALGSLELKSTISIASPLSILRELFTVRGEGTLIKRGAAIESMSGLGSLKREQVQKLLEEAFGRRVLDAFWQRQPERVYFDPEIRALALLESGREASFLSKFAVLPVARGEGLGQDLWWALTRENVAVYWRSRPQNPINAWYQAVCDGMHRTDKWHVYWRGVQPEALPSLIEDAIQRPEDFLSSKT